MQCLAAVLLIALCQPTDTPITLTAKARALDEVVAKVAAQTDQKLSVSNELKDFRVIVLLDKVPKKQTMDKLAEVFYAEWVATDDGIVLKRTTESRKRREALDVAERQIWLEKAIAELKPYDDLGLDEFLIESVKSAGAKRIAVVAPGARLVFSTRPTRMQKPFGSRLDKAFERFVIKKREDVAKAGPDDEVSKELLERTAPGGGIVHLCVTAHSDSYTLGVNLCDPAGGELGFAFAALNKPSPTPNQQDLEGLDAPFVASELGEAYRATYKDRNKQDMALNPVIIDAFTNPEEHDFLEGDPSDAILQIAKAKKMNAIVAVRDDLATFDFRQPAKTLVEAFNNLREPMRLVLDKEQGWLTGAPPLYGKPTLDNYPRKPLAKMLSGALKRGGVQLADMLEYLRTCVVGGAAGFVPILLEQSLPGFISNGQLFPGDAESWALCATLSPAQLQSAQIGITLPLSALTKEQRAIIEHRVYDQGFFRLSGSRQPQERRIPGLMGNILDEPTSAFPEGLPKAGSIHIRLASRDTILCRQKGSEYGWSFATLDPEEIAERMYLRELSSYDVAVATHFQSARRYDLKVVYDFGPMGYVEETSEYAEFLPKGNWRPLEDLPQSYTDAIQKRLKQFHEEADKDSRKGGNTIPP